jgi:two-component system OmpR family response regulator
MITVIIVQADGALCDTIGTYLTTAGMAVRCFGSAELMLAAFDVKPADIVVLDLYPPGDGGLAAAAQLRSRSDAGLILTADLRQSTDRLACLTSGADFCLATPVDMLELEAAIVNLAWRMRRPPARDDVLNAVKCAPPGQWVFDRPAWALLTPTGIRVPLTAAEYKILSMLVAGASGSSVAREDIMAGLGKAALAQENRSIDIVLSRLRKKVAEKSGQSLPVKAARAKGYVFAASVISQG